MTNGTLIRYMDDAHLAEGYTVPVYVQHPGPAL